MVWLNLKPEFPEFFQGLSIAAGVIHRIMRVLRKAKLFPFGRFGRILDEAGLEICEGSSVFSKPSGKRTR